MKRFLFIVFIALAAKSTYAHKFYVSIADMKYNEAKQRIEGSVKLTAHDFEAVLENKFGQKYELETIVDSSEVGRYIQTYLASHVKLFSNDKQAVPTYLGKEITLRGDLYFYFTFTQIANPAEITIFNTLLFELFPKQQNIIHYQYKEQTKSVTLVPSKTHEKIRFD